MRQKRLAMAVATTAAVATALISCTPSNGAPNPSPASETTESQDAVAQHESGPASPIGYGLQVPEGATQLGPLVRFRSAALIEAYQPVLDAATAKEEAEEQQRADEAQRNGETVAPPPPTPSTRPGDDTFDLLEDPPRPDSTISLMRLDGKPSSTVKAMIRQIAAVVPGTIIDANNLGPHCDVEGNRYTGCALDVTGTTETGRDLRITMDVDPGNIDARVAPAAAQTRPVMKLAVTYVGDPVAGQREPEPTDLGELPESADDVEGSVFWPRMDVDDDATEPLLDGEWTVPEDSTLLLSGDDPAFAVVHTPNGRDADRIASEFIASHGEGEPEKDVVEDLNEISTTYRTQPSDDGPRATASYILSGRGTYVMLFFTPAEGDDS